MHNSRGCGPTGEEEAQGYLIGRPQSANEIETLLATANTGTQSGINDKRDRSGGSGRASVMCIMPGRSPLLRLRYPHFAIRAGKEPQSPRSCV